MKKETKKELALVIFNARKRFGLTRTDAKELVENESWLKRTLEKELCNDPRDNKLIKLIEKALTEIKAEETRKIFKDGLLKCDIPEIEAELMAERAYPL